MESNRLLKLLELQAQNPEDLFNTYAVAMEYLSLQENVKAKLLFETVIQIDKNYVPAYYQLGLLLIKQNNEVDALYVFEKGHEQAKIKNDARAIREFKAAIDELSF